jgi:hypothetical protein
MNWLRNNDPNPADVDDPTAQGLANLLATHARPNLSPEKARVVEDSVNWPATTSQARGRQRAHSYGSDEPRGNTNAEGAH